MTPRTRTTLESLRHDFVRIRRRGYAVDNEEHEEGVSCVAAPVFDAAGVALAGIRISAPTPRIVHAETGELGQLLFHHAAEPSDALAHEAAPDQVRADAG